MEFNLNFAFAVFCLTVLALYTDYLKFNLKKSERKKQGEEHNEIAVTLETKNKEDGSPQPPSEKINP